MNKQGILNTPYALLIVFLGYLGLFIVTPIINAVRLDTLANVSLSFVEILFFKAMIPAVWIIYSIIAIVYIYLSAQSPVSLNDFEPPDFQESVSEFTDPKDDFGGYE